MRHLPAAMLCLSLSTPLPAAEPRSERQERWYRAGAEITVFGLTVFSRGNVGGGFARVVENPGPSGPNLRLLFVSGSRPDRAHGLNRMGYIEESVSEGQAAHAEYLGFMTASGEESLADAKKALHGPSSGDVEFVASRGEIDSSSTRSTVCRLPLPSSARWTDAPLLLGTVQRDLNSAGDGNAHTDLSRGEHPATFLYTVFRMVRSPARVTDGAFVHNGKLFHLHAVKRPDPKVGAQFADARLIASPFDSIELAGAIRNAKTGAETAFRVWFDRSSPNALPLRFEFQPKSYLKLVFDAQPSEDQAVAKSFAISGPHTPPPDLGSSFR